MIPQEKISEVAERLSIVDVIGEYVQLKRSGSNFTGLCPFHGEKTPSFNVNPAREIFHCFGCGAGGDIFRFVMQIEGISFPESIRKLAERAGVTIEDRPLTPAEQRQKSEREQQLAILNTVMNHYRELLTRSPEGAAARSYLNNREVDPETSAAYQLGYASSRRESLMQALQAKGLSLELAVGLGVLKKNDRGGWYDLLHSRLIFPIRDKQGQPIAFAGRVLDSSLPKYINSPESAMYRKSNTLFGLDLALREIRQSGSAIVVEGYFDHLALYRAGVKNVLATCGTALTDGHIALLKKHGDRVYLLFDGDNAGQKAAVKAMELCLEQKLPAYIITLPAGEDPDSFVQKHGAEAFRLKVESSKPAFEQFLLWLLTAAPPDSIDRKVRLLDSIIPRFRKISDPVERDLYEKEICRLLGVEIQAFRRRLAGEKGNSAATADKKPAAQPQKRKIKREPVQETVLGLMATYEGARKEIAAQDLSELFDANYLVLAEALIKEAEGETDTAGLWPRVFATLEDQELQELGARLLVADAPLADIDWKVALRQCLLKRRQTRSKELKEIAVSLTEFPEGSDEYKQLLNRANELRNKKSELK
jgi:DNA primase